MRERHALKFGDDYSYVYGTQLHLSHIESEQLLLSLVTGNANTAKDTMTASYSGSGSSDGGHFIGQHPNLSHTKINQYQFRIKLKVSSRLFCWRTFFFALFFKIFRLAKNE